MANSIQRSVQLLMLLASNQVPTTISEVAARLDTSVASASRMIQTLTEAGMVYRDAGSGRFMVAPELSQVGSAALSPMEFRRTVLPAIAAAIPDLQRPVNIGVPSINNGVWLESLSLSGRFVTSQLMGIAIPYHAATLGKVMLAFMPAEDAERILARKLQRYTPATIVEPEALRSELALIRDCGFAINRAEFRENGLAIAVPVLNAFGRTVTAFSVPASQSELDPDGEVIRTLAHLGRSISHLLGYAEESRDSFV